MARKGAEYIGTMEVQEKHRFDEQSLGRFMSANVEGFVAPVRVEQFKGGQSNPTYRLTDGGGRRYVLRRKPPGKLLPSAHAVDREFRVISALNRTNVPTPRAYALCEDESVVGTAFYIMEYCDGRVLWDPLLPDVPKEGRLAIYRAKFETLARLHAVDHVALGLGDFGRPGSYVARQISRWGKQYKASETEQIEAMDRLLDWLPANLPPNDETVLVHGDYRLDNMIFHASEPRVLGIIDWEISTLGDPLAELSYLCMLWRTPKDWGACWGTISLTLACRARPRWWPITAASRNGRYRRPRSGTSTWPTIFSASPASARVSTLARSMARPPMFGPPNRARWCVLPPSWHGASSNKWPEVPDDQAQAGAGGGRGACRRRARVTSTGRGDPCRGLCPVRRARLPGGDGSRHHEGLRPDPGRALQPLQVERRAAARHHHLDTGELERQCKQAVAGAGDDPRAQLAAFVRVYVVRHCRLRIEALVANREIGWLDAERVADIRRSRRAIRDIVVAIFVEGVKRGVFDPPQVDGRNDFKAIAMALLDQCTHVSKWYGPGGDLTEEQMANLYADMALRMVGAQPSRPA